MAVKVEVGVIGGVVVGTQRECSENVRTKGQTKAERTRAEHKKPYREDNISAYCFALSKY